MHQMLLRFLKEYAAGLLRGGTLSGADCNKIGHA